MKRILPVILSLFLTASLSFAQGKENSLHFDTRTIHLGKVMDNAGGISRTFLFKNTGENPLLIQEINTSCSCLSARYDRKPVGPGESGQVTLTFDPHNFSSSVEVKAQVYTNESGRHPAATLSLQAEVQLSDKWRHLPYKIGNLRLKRTKLSIGEVSFSNHRKERILCANIGDKPMKISGQMLPDYASLSVDPAIIPPGGEADIWIQIDGQKLSAVRDREKEVHFKILLQGTGGSVASRMIEVTVQPYKKKVEINK